MKSGWYDIGVVGAGPAGAAGALAAARRGARVVVFEAEAGPQDAACGDALLPEGADVLGALDLFEARAAGRPFAFVRFVLPRGAPLDERLPRPGLAVPRVALQTSLDRALGRQRRVTRVWERASVEPLVEGYRLTSAQGNQYARALLVADGASGTTAPWLRGTRVAGAAPLGVRARFRADGPVAGLEVHVGARSTVLLTPLADGVVTVSCVLAATPREEGRPDLLLEAALVEHPRARERLGVFVVDAQARRLPESAPRRVAKDGVFLVGDAAGPARPWIGTGMTTALRSGILAAEAARRLASGERAGEPERAYARAMRAEHARHGGIARLLFRLPRRPWLLGAAASVARLAPGLVGAGGAERAGSAEPWYAH